MRILKVMFGKGIPLKYRIMAVLNITSALFFMIMTGLVTYVCWFIVLPYIHRYNYRAVASNDAVIAFLFVNAIGNYILCVTTNTAVSSTWNRAKPQEKKLTRTMSSEEKGKLDGQEAESQNLNHTSGSTNRIENGSTDSKIVHQIDGKKYKALEKCQTCQVTMPLRSHHCFLCGVCILRRDHHCFFMTTCIGHNNHRYFILYCLYMTFGIFYGLVLIFRYLNEYYNVQFSSPLTFFTLAAKVLGELRIVFSLYPTYLFFIFLFYACLFTGLATAAFTFWHLAITFAGQTSHEAWKGITEFDSGSIYKNFTHLFGQYWFVSLFMPVPFALNDDGYCRSRYKKKVP